MEAIPGSCNLTVNCDRIGFHSQLFLQVRSGNGTMSTARQDDAMRFGQYQLSLVAGATILICGVAWLYWEPMSNLVGRWIADPDYQYGFLVPAFSVFLLWHRRSLRPSSPTKGSLWGLAFLALAAAMIWLSTYFLLGLPKPLSLVPCLAGIALVTGGWKTLRWAWPSIVFLAFMVPLPGFLGGMLSQPLQRVGTVAGTCVIQMAGIPAAAQGNVIMLADAEIGVVEACSGLRMLMLFVTICVGSAFVMQRSWPEKLIIVLAAIPIAVIANVARISVTAMLYEVANSELAHDVFHNLAGWFMAPLAVVMLLMLMAVLSKLIEDVDDTGPVAMGLSPGVVTRRDTPGGKPSRKTPQPLSVGVAGTGVATNHHREGR